mmetsp:Transcript_16775/g.20187  ORF Transcript_16775/g.20187 Transcript_16775/m.20187 type:complete len:154 (+) Transcript_16775:16-477(+)
MHPIVSDRVQAVKRILFPDADEVIVNDWLHILLFADDTTLLQEVIDFIEATFENPDSDLSIYINTIYDPVMQENLLKRIQGFMTALKTRNLGVNTDHKTDTTAKCGNAWAAWYSLTSDISGLKGISKEEKGALIIAMIRSILPFGFEARGVSP